MKLRWLSTAERFMPSTRSASKSFMSVFGYRGGTTAACLALLLSSVVGATDLDLNLTEDTVRLSFVTATRADGGTTIDAGALLAEQNEDSDALLAHFGVLIYGDTGAPRANVKAGIGLRAIALDADPDISGGAIAVGGQLAARAPDFDRIGFNVASYYSPGITAFGEVEEFLEYRASVDYQLIRRAFLYLGYRQIKFKVSGQESRITLDTGFHGGIRLQF